jgi:hypothetical protein
MERLVRRKEGRRKKEEGGKEGRRIQRKNKSGSPSFLPSSIVFC